jgi:hypothetical protein
MTLMYAISIKSLGGSLGESFERVTNYFGSKARVWSTDDVGFVAGGKLRAILPEKEYKIARRWLLGKKKVGLLAGLEVKVAGPFDAGEDVDEDGKPQLRPVLVPRIPVQLGLEDC